MDIKHDFPDIDAFLEQGYQDVVNKLKEIGEESVAYAKETGDYHDVTGNLRRSNDYKADKSGLELINHADYASNVESRGNIVLSSAILYAERRLKEEFE